MPDDAVILSLLGNLQGAIDTTRTETTGAINGLRTDLSGRMDQMITRREHESEVRRIDAETEANRRAIEANRCALEDHETEAAAQWRSVAEQIAASERKREDAQKAAAERRVADRRFIATWLTGAVGVAVAVATLLQRIWGV